VHWRPASLVVASLLLPAPAAGEAAWPAARALAAVEGEGGAALAILEDGPHTGAAVGDARGLRVPGRAGRVLARAPVRGLCAAPGGGLFVLLPDALLFREAGGAVRRLASLPGTEGSEAGHAPERENTAPARRLACLGGFALLLRPGGVEVFGRDGRRPGGLSGAAARGLRIVRTPAPQVPARRIALASDREVFEARLERRGSSLRLEGLRLRHRAGPGSREAVVDVALPAPGELLVLTGEALHEFGPHGGRVRELVLRPGARPTALAAGPRALVVATTRGFLLAVPPGAPLRPAPGPPGSRPGVDAAVRGEAVFLLGRRRLWAVPPGPATAGPANRRRPTAPRGAGEAAGTDPPVQAVHRAALRYLGLEARALDDLRRAASRRGRMPEIDFELYGGRDRRRTRERDEAFLSGEHRVLRDADVDRDLEYGARLRISVDLRDLVFDPERIDASRELRALVALRDDVLGEVTRLYFERQRLRLELDRIPSGPERALLALRAAELAAGLDAWTGGWFGRAVGRPPAPQSTTPVPKEGDHP